MTICSVSLKYSKSLFHRQIPNDNGLNIRLYRMAHPMYVGGIIITKELKNSYRGYLIRVTHEEFKQGVFKTLNASDIPDQPIN